MKKVLLISCFTVIILLLAAGAGVIKAYFLPPVPVIPEYAQTTPAQEAAPGTTVNCRFNVTLPADLKIEKISLHAGGTQAGEVSAKFQSWRWDRNRWEISGTFRVLQNDLKDGSITLITDSIFRSASGEKLTVKIPELTVKLPENAVTDEELFLAPETVNPETAGTPILSRKKTIFFIIAGILLLIAASIGILLFLRHRKSSAIPLGEATIRQIRELNSQVSVNEIRPETGFAKLCDILRGYLEKRFSLPVTRCTTDEFIRDTDFDQILPERKEQLFLTGFLNSADMIKFAGNTADKQMFDRAAAQAEELVTATTAQEDKK